MISWNEPIDKVVETANKYNDFDKVISAYKDSYKKEGEDFPYELSLVAYNEYVQ